MRSSRRTNSWIKGLLTWVKGPFAFSKNFCYNDYRKCEEEVTIDMMKLISEKELEYMRNYIQDYAPINNLHNGDWCSMDYLLRFWEEAKGKYLLHMFGGKLILEREIEYEASPDELLKRFNEVAHSKSFAFFNDLYELFWKNPAFDSFRFDHYKISGTECWTSTFSYLNDRTNLLTNRWELPTIRMPLPNGKSFKVCPGTKITRILGRLAEAWNLKDWDDVLKAQAIALTSRKTKGTLCLSIHPLDYMTMSDNEENWDSCMNWKDQGGYRAGTVEMMNSSCVVVAYIKHHERQLDDFWNSKTWRELFIVTDQLITNIKPYPYVNEYLTKTVSAWLRDLAEQANVGRYHKDIMLYAKNETRDDEFIKKMEFSFRFYTDVMYNDCGRSDMWMYLSKFLAPKEYIAINYSGERICMMCGERSYNYANESSLLCLDCSNEYIKHCTDCDEGLTEGNIYYIHDDPLCYDCYSECAVRPYDDQDDAYYHDECDRVYLKLPGTDVHSYDYYLYFTKNCDVSDFARGYDAWLRDEEGDAYVEYNAVRYSSLLYEFGLNTRDLIRYNNYHLSPKDLRALLEKYDNDPFNFTHQNMHLRNDKNIPF